MDVSVQYHKMTLHEHITNLVGSLVQEAKDTRIQSSQVFTSYRETGVAVLTKSNRIFMVNNVHEPKTRKYPDLPGGLWAVDRDLTKHTHLPLPVCLFYLEAVHKSASFWCLAHSMS